MGSIGWGRTDLSSPALGPLRRIRPVDASLEPRDKIAKVLICPYLEFPALGSIVSRLPLFIHCFGTLATGLKISLVLEIQCRVESYCVASMGVGEGERGTGQCSFVLCYLT